LSVFNSTTWTCDRCKEQVPLCSRGRPPKQPCDSCRNKLRYRARRPLVEKTCVACSVLFVPIKNSQQAHCSTCSTPTNRARRRRRLMGVKPLQPRQYFVCIHCETTFPRSKSGRTKNLFCSRNCAYAWRSARKRQPQPLPLPSCRDCGTLLTSRRVHFCVGCREVRRVASWRKYYPPVTGRKNCLMCGDVLVHPHCGCKRKYCSPKCNNRAQKIRVMTTRRVEYRIQRAKLKKRRDERLRCGAVERFLPQEIFERDNWRCHICKKKVRRAKKARGTAPHPMSPTIDHLVPLSQGGEHARINVACAHFICNSRRSDIGAAQLLLFG
jgi:hypothetical protein